MNGKLSSLVLLVLSSCLLVGGQTSCSLSVFQFHSSTITVNAESVGGSTPGVRVTWNTTLPPECVTSVRVEFRTSRHEPAVATYTTTNTSQTEVIQTGLQCATNYYIRVVATGEIRPPGGMPATHTLSPRHSDVQVFVGDIPFPVRVRAEVTADNTSIGVLWEWSRQDVPACVNIVSVHYQPEGGSEMMYTVDNTIATSATLPNLQCDTEYTIWVYARGGTTSKRSVSRTVILPAPSTPIDVTVQLENTSSVRVSWQWTSSAPDCFNTTTVTYRPEGGGEYSLQLSDPAATEATLTDIHNSTCYIMTVVATAGEHRRGGVVRTVLPQQDPPDPVGVRAKPTSDNSSIRVAWEWSPQGVVCFDLVTVHYRPEGGSLMMYTVDNTTATSAILPNLQCNTEYTVWVQARRGRTSKTSVFRAVFLPARAPHTPTDVTAQFANASSVRVAWQWTSSGPAPSCFNTTTVTYRSEKGNESSLQLRDPVATEATLTDLQCNTSYTITVVATAGEHRREEVTFLSIQGLQNLSAVVLSSTSVHLTWVAPCHTQQYHIYYRGTCGTHVDEGRLDTERHQEYTLHGLQKGINYSFTVNQTGFSGGRVLSTGPVHARTFTAVPSGAPQSLQTMFVQPTEVSLSWKEVLCVQQNGPITGYVVRYYATCGADGDIRRHKSVVTAGDIIDDLTPNTEYVFQVAAVNVNGTGPFSEPITLGGFPQLIMVTPVNSTTVTVSWSEVQCFNGSGAVTHYLVQYQSMCGGAVQNVTTSGLVQNVSGLTPNCVYSFQVAAGQKIGPFSNPANTSLPDTPHILPEVPTQWTSEAPTQCTSEVSTQCTSTSTVAGVAIAAVLVLMVVAVVQSAVIWHQRRSIARIKSRRATAVTTDIPLKECSAYGQIDQQSSDEREEPHIYERPQ